MNRTILYYPTINIPDKSWLRHALLYYDEVSSIVPQSWDERILINLSSEIHYLIDQGQFRPMKPEDLIINQMNWDAFDHFKNEFINIVSDPFYNNFVSRHPSNYQIHRSKIEDVSNLKIHRDKISESILHFLQENNLATQSEDYDWIKFESNTALLYMALLAKYLADIDGNQTSIGTNLKDYENFNFKRVTEDKGFPVISLSLNNILPSPKSNVPLEKIIDFKRKRDDNLRHFKSILSDYQTKISNTKSFAEFKEISANFNDALINGVNDLNAVISDSRMETGFKVFKSLIDIKSPTLLTAAGAVLNNKYNFINTPVSWEVFAIGMMGVIEVAGHYIEERNKERARLRESPFSYMYFANRYGIINRPSNKRSLF